MRGQGYNEIFDGASIRIVKRGPEDYQAYVSDFQTGSETDRSGESIAEVLNASFDWLDLGIQLTIG